MQVGKWSTTQDICVTQLSRIFDYRTVSCRIESWTQCTHYTGTKCSQITAAITVAFDWPIGAHALTVTDIDAVKAAIMAKIESAFLWDSLVSDHSMGELWWKVQNSLLWYAGYCRGTGESLCLIDLDVSVFVCMYRVIRSCLWNKRYSEQ